MSTIKQTLSHNSSVASSQISTFEDIDSIKIKNYVKELLKSRIFLGRYVERRLIDSRIGYRDVVVISAAETELKRDLLESLHKLRSVCSHWIGITDTEYLGQGSSGICLATEIENQPFGPFWFQIKTIRFRDQEVIVLLKCLRHISDAFLELEPMLTGSTKKQKEINDNMAHDVVSLGDTYKEIVGNLKDALSISNVKEFFTFLIAFIIAVFTGSTAFVNFLGNFVLALIREMSILIKNSTPMFLGVLDFFSKIVGGFYILLAMVFKPSNSVPLNKRTITYDRQQRHNNYYDNRQYDDRHFD